MRWMVSAPMRAKNSDAPAVNEHRSNPESHLRFRSVRVAARNEVSLQ
jgi:hypothetical protein